MAKLKLSKHALQKERENLKLYQRLLPSLDLKRRQLSMEFEKARRAHSEAQQAADQLEAKIGSELPMLANTDIDLNGLVKVKNMQLGQENIVGVKLPVVDELEYEVTDYPLLARPAWVDVAVVRLKDATQSRIEVTITAERVRILDRAVLRVTQRVNLFDRILIPSAKDNIKRIQIFLGDIERDAVVRSKIAKGKNKPLVMAQR